MWLRSLFKRWSMPQTYVPLLAEQLLMDFLILGGFWLESKSKSRHSQASDDANGRESVEKDRPPGSTSWLWYLECHDGLVNSTSRRELAAFANSPKTAQNVGRCKPNNRMPLAALVTHILSYASSMSTTWKESKRVASGKLWCTYLNIPRRRKKTSDSLSNWYRTGRDQFSISIPISTRWAKTSGSSEIWSTCPNLKGAFLTLARVPIPRQPSATKGINCTQARFIPLQDY